jgi:hypothetical protein
MEDVMPWSTPIRLAIPNAGGFELAMYDQVAMGLGDGVLDGGEEGAAGLKRECFGEGSWRDVVHVFEDEVGAPSWVVPPSKEAGDVGMFEFGEDLPLLPEAVAGGEVDGAHTADADRLDDPPAGRGRGGRASR